MKTIQALENNLRKRFSYFQNQLSGMEVTEKNNLMIASSHKMTDMFNIVCCYGEINEKQVTETVHYFKNKQLPFAWWVGFEGESEQLPHWLQACGLKQAEEELAMAIELSADLKPQLPSGLTIEYVNNNNQLNDFIQVIGDLVPDEAKAIQEFYQQAASIIFAKDSMIQLYVGHIENQPISTCSVFFTENVAGIFDIIASPSVRGRGVGSAMTMQGMKASLEQGYKLAVLTATDDAKFLYEKLGFKSLKLMHVYIPIIPEDANF